MESARSDDGWMAAVRSLTDARLTVHFAFERERVRGLGDEGLALLTHIETLTMRGGKRLRPALMVAAFRAVAPDRRADEVADACAALELLQTYLLIHDDWMDQDDARRGGLSVHAALRRDHERQLADSLAILVGNLASAHAWGLMANGPWADAAKRGALDAFLDVHREVVIGQQLDLLGGRDVSRMQRLKTGSYTVRGPLRIGASLAGANERERAGLDRFADPLGEAFQMRDDLLGTFGDPGVTGKPLGSDLRRGRRTAIVQAAEELGAGELVARVHDGLGDDDLGPLTQALIACGAKARVEAKLDALLADARAALADAPLADTRMLAELADRLAQRDR